MFSKNDDIASVDPDLWRAMRAERERQEDHIELIASENYASPAVLEAQGSVLTNKYAEGYPGKRYYGGCEFVDEAENLAIERAKKLFHAEYVNVQPHSGSQANQAVFVSVLEPGDTLLGMSLASGGHLTHGSPVNLSGKFYEAVGYGLNDREEIDYDQVEHLAMGHKPKLIVAGASAYALHIDWKRFREIADKAGALFMADIAHYAGLIAAGYYPSPVGIAHFVTSTTHKTLRGPRGGIIMASAGYEKMLNSAIFPVLQGGPLMHVIAAKAVAFKEAMGRDFRRYQEQVIDNARVMAKVLAERGYRIVSGRTDCHLFLVDLRGKGVTGKEAEEALGRANITVNKNSVPNDPEKPFVTSGIRVGSPAITTRGFQELEAEAVANLIGDVLDNPRDEANIARARTAATALCRRFPVYES
ncbi:MAG: serine hydroxymethyltransferase [Burkholderiales bacterium]|jgi:glycine hydroxymethyltransferase|nr:serine hydroxymethyltransferase [Burkholderiales bacterium]